MIPKIPSLGYLLATCKLYRTRQGWAKESFVLIHVRPGMVRGQDGMAELPKVNRVGSGQVAQWQKRRIDMESMLS